MVYHCPLLDLILEFPPHLMMQGIIRWIPGSPDSWAFPRLIAGLSQSSSCQAGVTRNARPTLHQAPRPAAWSKACSHWSLSELPPGNLTRHFTALSRIELKAHHAGNNTVALLAKTGSPSSPIVCCGREEFRNSGL